MIELVQGASPFVAFVGAGASAMPPSRLPTWSGFNNLVLECLCEKLAEYSGNRQPTAEMLSRFRQVRDHSGFFAPDFQAQLMEEEVGTDYFRVWQSLSTDVYGPVHAGLAELAARGRLGAIVTTNFDCLIETALRERGVAFDVRYEESGFEKLAADGKPAVLPVFKIHGSMEDATSLVDTLKQRVVGRPPALMQAIRGLLMEYPWLYLGFSGADFNYNPRYLGILDAAAEAKGFVFLARDGSRPADGLRGIVEAYGTGKASILFGDLSNCLSTTFDLPGWTAPLGRQDDKGEAEGRVRRHIAEWVNGLGPMAVVNITVSMLKTLQMDRDAFWLMRKTWKSYRLPENTHGKSYGRYNYNYGLSLLNAGFIRNLVAREDNFQEWKEQADQNAAEFFGRSYQEDPRPSTGAHWASVLAYRGEVGKAIGLTSQVCDQAIEQGDKLELLEVAIACVPVYDIVRLFDLIAAHLRAAMELAQEVGDEPRRGMLCAHLARFLSYGQHFDEVEGLLREADTIGERLGLTSVLLASRAARGRWYVDSGKSDAEAVEILRRVVEIYHRLDDEPLYTKIDALQPDAPPKVIKGRSPALVRVLLDLNRAARFAGDTEVLNRTLDELDELATEVYRGYCPHYYLAHAECSANYGDEDQKKRIPELIERAREMGKVQGNPWVQGAILDLQKRIE